jgi:hypothetical protein
MVNINQLPISWNRILNSLGRILIGKDRKMKIADCTFFMLYMAEITILGMNKWLLTVMMKKLNYCRMNKHPQ